MLTDPAVVSVRVRTTQATSLAQPDVRAAMASPAWTAEEILTFVATSEPPFHALIDTGALITGMDNVDVARFLLDKGLPHVDACVYLDEFDRQKIVVRGNPAPQSLHEVGVPVERRFVFYDQIHHTGIDIPHAVNARAAVTIGKDMTLREYSQGAFPRGAPAAPLYVAHAWCHVGHVLCRLLAHARHRMWADDRGSAHTGGR